jgi:DNA-binding FadR family transcriptional regulator
MYAEEATMAPVESNSTSTRSSVLLTPVDVPKASDVLARELRERILSGELTEGTALPAERELVKQTQMSRATVREALRILEVQNLVRVRAGRAGGAFVQRPTTKSMANSVTLMIRGQKIKLADLMETREALEPFCAELAARNRTDDDLAVLDKANKDIANPDADLPGFLQANYTGTENAAFVDDDVRAVTQRAHRSITTAIRSRDAEAAARRMRRHVHSYAKAALAMDDREAISVDD